MKHEKMFQDKMKRTKRGVLAPVKLDRSPKKDPSRRKLTTWHPEDEDDFAIHPRRQTKWSPKRRKKPTPEQQNNKSKKNKYDTTKPLKGEDVHQHMSRTKTHTVNIFTSNARSLAWLEADAIVRRKYEEFSGASASLYAAQQILQIESVDMSEEAAAAKKEAGDGYRPYVPGHWIKEELIQRRSLSAGKPTGKLSAHFDHQQAAKQVWKQLNLLYQMIADPKYASKNMRVAASINDALRARLQRQGAALAFTNLAPLHWVSKDHFLCLLFAYYKFNPFQAHARIGHVYDSSLAERPYVERMLFRESFSMTDKVEMHTKANTKQRKKELMRLGSEVVRAVKEDKLPEFIGSPMPGTRANGSPNRLRVRPVGGRLGNGMASMLDAGMPGSRPHLDDSLKINDRRVQNTENVYTGAQIDAMRLVYPSRVDRRVIVSRLRLLEQPMAVKKNMTYCMEMFEWEVTGGCRLRDFVQIIALPAVTESECQLAIAVREAMLQREQDVVMFRNVQEEKNRQEMEQNIFTEQNRSEEEVLQSVLVKATELKELKEQAAVVGKDEANFLDKIHPFHFYHEFLQENPMISIEFRQQCINRLTDDNKARVLNAQCDLTLERWNQQMDSMKRKKAMYYLVHRLVDTCLTKWKKHTKNAIVIRKSCEYAEQWYNETFRKRAVLQWKKWAPIHKREEEEMERTLEWYSKLVFKQMFRRWKSTTLIEKKLRLMEAARIQIEYEHALKNLIRLMDRTILRKVKASSFYAFSRWKQIIVEEIVFEKSVIWWRQSLARKAFNRLRDEAWEKINARYQTELDKNARQEEMMEAAREGERLAHAERERVKEERRIEAARLKAIADEKQKYEDKMFAQRAAAMRQQEQITIRAYQREGRLKQVKSELDKKENKMNGKWDSVEAGMADKARFVAQELFDTPKGKRQLISITYDMIEEIAATIKTREEREACIALNTVETPRQGRPNWRIRYNEKEASRYWYHKKTEEEIYPEFLTEYTKESKRKGKEMAMNLYADRKVVESRGLSLKLREKAWDKEVRMYNAKRLSAWWRRMLCRKNIIEEQWRADLQRFRTRKAKFHPASTIIQGLARMWLAHPWLEYMVRTQQQITRYDDDNGGATYWFNGDTQASTWEPPTCLSKLLESRLTSRIKLKEERVPRMGKKKRDNDRRQAMINAGLISNGKAGGGYAASPLM
tara:strand:+ start:214 stop:3777 length:3564 start_codon:yes stop_codon:yes gene_type:complete